VLLDVSFFDEAVPTSKRAGPGGATAAAALLDAAAAGDGAGEDVPDYASVITKLRKIFTYRYAMFRYSFSGFFVGLTDRPVFPWSPCVVHYGDFLTYWSFDDVIQQHEERTPGS